MRKKRYYLICYDISDDIRLRTVAKRLEQEAIRVQYSVFCYYGTSLGIKALLAQVTPLITREDDLRCYTLTSYHTTCFIGESLIPENIYLQ